MLYIFFTWIFAGHGKKRKCTLNVPEQHRLSTKVEKRGHKSTFSHCHCYQYSNQCISANKVYLLSKNSKPNITEVKQYKSKQNILKDNLKKLKKIKRLCAIDLDKDVTKQLIERAVTRRPVRSIHKKKGVKKTAFTEEDFQKFEEEYFDE